MLFWSAICVGVSHFTRERGSTSRQGAVQILGSPCCTIPFVSAAIPNPHQRQRTLTGNDEWP